MDIPWGMKQSTKRLLVLLLMSIVCNAIVPTAAITIDDYYLKFDLEYDIAETHYYGYSGEKHISDVESFEVNISRNTLGLILADLTVYGYPLWLDVESLESGELLMIDRRNYTMTLVGDFWRGYTIGFYRGMDSYIHVYYDQELGFLESVSMTHIQQDDDWWDMLIDLNEECMYAFDQFRETHAIIYNTSDVFLISLIVIEVTVILFLFRLRRTIS
jgi:hypothetical protein